MSTRLWRQREDWKDTGFRSPDGRSLWFLTAIQHGARTASCLSLLVCADRYSQMKQLRRSRTVVTNAHHASLIGSSVAVQSVTEMSESAEWHSKTEFPDLPWSRISESDRSIRTMIVDSQDCRGFQNGLKNRSFQRTKEKSERRNRSPAA